MSRSTAITVVICLLVTGVCFASAPTDVSVTLSGPTEGWAGDPLGYSAIGSYSVDGETQEEVEDEEATINEEYSWSYGPASCETPPAEDSTETFVFAAEHAPGTYTITVTYKVIVNYADGTSHSDSATDSIDVKIKLYVDLTIAAGGPICAGAMSSPPHQCTVTATARDRSGNPLSGRSLSFSIHDPGGNTYVQNAASFSSATGTTDEDGNATTILTSSDKQCVLVVVVGDDESEDSAVCEVAVSLPAAQHDPLLANGEAGLPIDLSTFLSFSGEPVPGHSVLWEVVDVTLADGDPGQTGEQFSCMTDGDGCADASYTHLPAAWVILRVSDASCYDSDEHWHDLGMLYLTFFELDHLEVWSALKCDDFGNWAAGIQNDPSNVVIRAVVRPSVYDPQMNRDPWSGGSPGPDHFTRHVSKQSAGITNVTCSIGNVSDSVTIYVCQVTGLSVYAGGTVTGDGCAVTTVEPSGNSYIVLEAAIDPTPPTIPGPLIWWYGASRDQTMPTRAGVSRQYPTDALVTCKVGDSAASMRVYIIEMEIGVPGGEGSTRSAKVFVNSDDDNGSSTQDRYESPVVGEDDLYKLRLDLRPATTSGGTFTITHDRNPVPSGELDLWEDKNKQSAVAASYDLAAGAPKEIWVEGIAVSHEIDDTRVEVTYNWGGVQITDTVYFTVLPREGDSSASLKLYSHSDLADAHEVSGTVGGILYPALYVTVGAGERLSSTSAPIIIRDQYTKYFSGTEVDMVLAENGLSPAGGWKKWNPGTETWQTDSGPVGTDNRDGADPIKYRAVLPEWNTMKQPLGNNGDHSVFVGEQDGSEWKVAHLEFEEWVVGDGWVNLYELGPIPVGVTIENLYIADCTASLGTIDYFKYDPDGDHSLAHPSISFTIVDADPHTYEWVIYFRQSAGSETWAGNDFWAVTGTANGVGTVTVNLTDQNLPGHLDPDVHPWGTYTYDVYVHEYDGGTEIDSYGLKLPYYQWVPNIAPDGPRAGDAGHRWWEYIQEDGSSEVRVEYYLNHQANLDAAELKMIPVDPHLDERQPTDGPTEHGVMHEGEDIDGDGEPDGIAVYEFSADDPFGEWRVLWTGADAAGPRSAHRRTHDMQRMLVANLSTPAYLPIVYIKGVHEGADWHGAWLRARHENCSTRYFHPVRRVATDLNSAPNAIRAGVNGGFFNLSEPYDPAGFTGTGSGWIGNPTTNPRYGFGFNRGPRTWQWRVAADTVTGNVQPAVKAYPFGLSCVGCLIDSGRALDASHFVGGGVDPDVRRNRTAVGWTSLGDVFIVVAIGSGWTWDQAQSFFASDRESSLNRALWDLFPWNPARFMEPVSAMMLDGGASTQFSYQTFSGITRNHPRPDDVRQVRSCVMQYTSE
jgi:hypothetical protein